VAGAFWKAGDTVVGVVLRHEGPFYLLDHYPKGDVFDPDIHAQRYYHAHDQKDRPGEHGHFHTFIRSGGMPAVVEPARLRHDLVCHLIAMSMDRSGWPIGPVHHQSLGHGRDLVRCPRPMPMTTAVSRSPHSCRSTSRRRCICCRRASRL
jgi:hypothetical protein